MVAQPMRFSLALVVGTVCTLADDMADLDSGSAVVMTPDYVLDAYAFSPEDILASADANEAKELFCDDGGFKGEVDQEAGRQALGGVSGENVIENILKSSKNMEELSTKASEEITPAWMIEQAAPLVLAIMLFVIFWCILCWTACPCCKCCRCPKKKQRKLGFIFKAVVAIIGIALFLGILIAAFVALGGYNMSVDGFDNLGCTSARLVESTLDGQVGPYFVGLNPVLAEFSNLERQLTTGSAMLNNISTIVDSTIKIQEAVTVAAAVLGLVGDVLGNEMPAELGTNKHDCKFCETIAPLLTETSTALKSGLGSALADARAEVAKQLTGSNTQTLKDQINSTSAPLVQLKDMVRDTFSFFTDVEKFGQLRNQLDGDIPLIKMMSAFLILLAMLLGMCMASTILSLFMCRKTKEGTPRPIAHRCACCTWFCGFNYAVLAFFIGGLLNAIGAPVGGLCLIMDDMSASLLTDIAPALDLDLAGESGDMLKDIIDKCMVAADGSNEALLDILTVKDNATAEPVTMNEKFVVSLKDEITGKFDDISTQMSSPTAKMANTSEVLTLVDMLSNPIDMMILPRSADDYKTDSDFTPMFAASGLSDAFVCSVRCSNKTVTDKVPELGGEAIAGVSSFVTALSTQSGGGASTSSRSDCANTVSCAAKSGADNAACNSGNKYVELKQKIRDLANFRCDTFEHPGPGSITGNSCTNAQIASRACLHADGKMKRKVKQCDLDDFVTYVQNYGPLTMAVMKGIDDATDDVFGSINNGLKEVVQMHILDPLDRVANGVRCGFMGKYYREVVDGLCFQGVVGFRHMAASYLACAMLSVFISILMYFVWRCTIDSYNAATGDTGLVVPSDENSLS